MLRSWLLVYWDYWITSSDGQDPIISHPSRSFNLRSAQGHMGSSTLWRRQSFSSSTPGSCAACPCSWNSLCCDSRRWLGCYLGPSRIWRCQCSGSRSFEQLGACWKDWTWSRTPRKQKETRQSKKWNQLSKFEWRDAKLINIQFSWWRTWVTIEWGRCIWMMSNPLIRHEWVTKHPAWPKLFVLGQDCTSLTRTCLFMSRSWVAYLFYFVFTLSQNLRLVVYRTSHRCAQETSSKSMHL